MRLVNQGAICYMNTLLQQLYLVSRFWRVLLALNWSWSHASTRSFSYCSCTWLLRSSACCNPGGRSINLGVQMDASEFSLNQLVDRLE